ncbi:MAG: histidine kinase [Vicinamibacterales bacterium]
MKSFLPFARIVLLSTVAVILFFGSFGHAGWLNVAANVGAAVLFSALIGVPMQLLLPRLAPRIFRQTTAPVSWLLLIGVMMTIAAVGSAVGIVMLAGVGLLPWSGTVTFFLNSLRVSLAITLTFGVGVTLYQRMRHRADAAELALRTKERDEAEARRAATEARLTSLESRVQPHFLFNTLNSIAALIPHDPRGAERMIGQLASLLRSSLDGAGTPLVPLAQELASTRAYLEIERVRFGDRLRYSIEVPDALGGTLVPRFALQTLVENSVKYAVATRRGGGTVTLSAEAVGQQVRVVVQDDGPGFDPATALPQHGLALVRERMALSFGERASLDIDGVPGRTRVVVEVPR